MPKRPDSNSAAHNFRRTSITIARDYCPLSMVRKTIAPNCLPPPLADVPRVGASGELNPFSAALKNKLANHILY